MARTISEWVAHCLRKNKNRGKLMGGALHDCRASYTSLSNLFLKSMDRLKSIRLKLEQFANERDWNQFHNPKNLAMALIAEAGELVEHFQWLSLSDAADLSDKTRAEVELEIADVLLFLVRLADKLGIDPIAAAEKKLILNAEKYPIEKAKGKSTKYTKL